jgi:hypothetical protein
VSHTLAHTHGLRLIDLKRNLKFQEKLDGPVLADSAFAGGARRRQRYVQPPPKQHLGEGRQGPCLTWELVAVEISKRNSR